MYATILVLIGIGITTLVLLLFLNIRRTRRDTEMGTHTQAKVKT